MNRFEVVVPGGRLDLAHCLTSGQVFRWSLMPDGAWLGVDGLMWYRVAEPSPGRFEIESNGTEEDFARFFRLDWDADAIEAKVLDSAPELANTLHEFRGLRLLRPSDPAETLLCFLCTSNNHIGRITSMIAKLAAHGEPLAEVGGVCLRRFPSLEQVATITESDLRAQGFGYRARSIPAAARQIIDRPAGWLEELRNRPYEQTRAELIDLPGVGPKLADCISLFALDHTEAVPVDTHIWQATVRLYRPDWAGRSLTPARLIEAGAQLRDRLGPLAG
ncbi:MAG: DNA-binding protein [Fimbriimonas ginsengisoli]|nr:DNA-binding protein [Fimbriimonas ginsengisoli]